MIKEITIDFFQVSIQSSLPKITSFEDILSKALSIPLDMRSKSFRLHPVYLLNIEHGWQDTWEGEIVQLRMDNIPVIGNISGHIENLQLNNDEGIGEQSAFIYHKNSKILAFEANKNGISPGGFAQYFELIAGGNTDVMLSPVLQINGLQRLQSMKDVTRMEINIAGLSNMSIFNTGDNGIQEIVQLTEAFEAPSISVEMKASLNKKEKNYLSKETVINTAQSLLRVSNHKTNDTKVKKIRITGKSNEEDNIYVDLLKDKMRERISVKSSTRNRSIPYDNRRIALQEAWNNRFDDIRKMYMS